MTIAISASSLPIAYDTVAAARAGDAARSTRAGGPRSGRVRELLEVQKRAATIRIILGEGKMLPQAAAVEHALSHHFWCKAQGAMVSVATVVRHPCLGLASLSTRSEGPWIRHCFRRERMPYWRQQGCGGRALLQRMPMKGFTHSPCSTPSAYPLEPARVKSIDESDREKLILRRSRTDRDSRRAC